MDTAWKLILSGILLATTARAELSLVPTTTDYVLEGRTLKQITFHDGATAITYQAPRGWEYSGDANRLTLHPPTRNQVEASISKIPLAQPSAFDDETVKRLVKEAVAAVPAGSQEVKVNSQEVNPVLIQGKGTFLVTLDYTFAGRHFCRSVLFFNRGHEQIRSQLTCLTEDFKVLQRAFFASQFTWQNL